MSDPLALPDVANDDPMHECDKEVERILNMTDEELDQELIKEFGSLKAGRAAVNWMHQKALRGALRKLK